MRHQKQRTANNLIEDLKRKQRNLVWPDMMVNTRGADEFLWRGSPNSTPVQRIAAGLFGVVFLMAAVVALSWVTRDGIVIPGVISMALFYISGRMIWICIRGRIGRGSSG
jgi:hypothetical protein